MEIFEGSTDLTFLLSMIVHFAGGKEVGNDACNCRPPLRLAMRPTMMEPSFMVKVMEPY